MTYTNNDVRELLGDLARACRVKSDEARNAAEEAMVCDATKLFHFHDGRHDAYAEVARAFEQVLETNLRPNRRVNR